MFSENSLLKKPVVETNKTTQEPVKDYEIYYRLLQDEVQDLIDKKKRGEITREELIAQRKPLDDQIDYSRFAEFKNKEMTDAFQFEGDPEFRRQVLQEIQGKESISDTGANQKGVFDISGNKIVKLVSKANYPYELPLVKLTEDLEGGNIIKTYDVFEEGELVYVVQDKAPGKEVHKYTKEEIDAIPQEHYDALVQLVNKYAEHRIGTDPSKISNLFYDPEKGFTIIDLGAATYQRRLDYHINNYFTNNLAHEKIENAIAKFGEYKLVPLLPTFEQKMGEIDLGGI